MKKPRQWVVEGVTPDGPVETSCEAAAHVTQDEIVAHLVTEYVNNQGLQPGDFRVTDVWSVEVT